MFIHGSFPILISALTRPLAIHVACERKKGFSIRRIPSLKSDIPDSAEVQPQSAVARGTLNRTCNSCFNSLAQGVDSGLSSLVELTINASYVRIKHHGWPNAYT